MGIAVARLPVRIGGAGDDAPRQPQVGGEDFIEATEAQFRQQCRRGDFALHWQAHGLSYGIPHASLRGAGTVLVNLSRGVLTQAQRQFPDLLAIFVTAPPQVLAARLRARGRESRAVQGARLQRADYAPPAALPAGLPLRIVVNDGSPEQGLARFLAALQPVSG